MSERAMLSSLAGEWDAHQQREARRLSAQECYLPGLAEREARRILAETEPKGGAVARVRLSSAASCRYLGHETSMTALAEALAAFVGDAQ